MTAMPFVTLRHESGQQGQGLIPRSRISVALDFSVTPCGRTPADSPWSGGRFREHWLAPALRAHPHIQVDLDGTQGYATSFLDEAFGGLVRLHGFAPDDLLKRIELVSTEDPTLINEIRSYLGEGQSSDEASPAIR